MIKPEDLLDAYDSLCICTQQKIEALFTKSGEKKLAAAFRGNWSYFMTSEASSLPPETLNMDQGILDASGTPVDLQTVAKSLDEPHVFLRLSHLLLDYSTPIDLLPASSSLQQNSKRNRMIRSLLEQLRLMSEAYYRLQRCKNADAAQQDLQLLGEFCKSYFWLGDSLAPIREKYAKFAQGDENRYYKRRSKNRFRINLYLKCKEKGMNDKKAFAKISQEEARLSGTDTTLASCPPDSYRAWKCRMIARGLLPCSLKEKKTKKKKK